MKLPSKLTIENLREQMCDNYCKFVGTCDEETMIKKCEECPMNDMLDDVIYEEAEKRLI